jgi:hypothetical protein
MDLALDPADDDLLISDGLLALVRGADAVAQTLHLRLALVRGSWFLDLGDGVPFLERVLIKGVNLDEVAALLRAEALKEPEVRDAVVTVTLTAATRSSVARVSATLVDGVKVDTAITLLPAAA